MEEHYIAHAEILVDAPRDKVWEALTRPDLIKQYLYGTEVTSDWRTGSSIRYRGEWKGRSYEDKGKVLDAVRGRRLMTSFWSSLEGRPDRPENYKRIIYSLDGPETGPTRLSLTQDNNRTREEAEHSEKNWDGVLAKLKEVAEQESHATIGAGLGL